MTFNPSQAKNTLSPAAMTTEPPQIDYGAMTYLGSARAAGIGARDSQNEALAPISGDSPQETSVKRKGFLGLPGEIRNIIYRLIGDDVGECYHLSGPRPSPTRFRIEGGKGGDCRPLSLTRLSPEVASEYLSLLLFHNASSDQMRPDAPHDAVNWDGSLDFPHFKLHAQKDIQEITSGSDYNRYDDGGEPGGRLSSWFDADWYDSQIRQISFTFVLYSAHLQLTQGSLDLIHTTLQRTFASNKDIIFEKFAAAADQLAHLNLTAVRISDWSAEPVDPEVVCFTVMSSTESGQPFIGMEDGDSYDVGLFWALMSGT